MSGVRNWKYFDIAYITIVFVMSFPCLMSRRFPFFGCVLLFIVMNILGGVFFLQWPRRFRDHKKRQYLLTLPTIHDVGHFSSVTPKVITSAPMAVSDGFSYNIRSGDIYEHYHYERFNVYDGKRAMFSGEKHFVIMNSLPRSFWGDEETILDYGGDLDVEYVTDADGNSYFIDAHPQSSDFPD